MAPNSWVNRDKSTGHARLRLAQVFHVCRESCVCHALPGFL